MSDPKKRRVYDQVGEEGLKGGMPPPGSQGFEGMGSSVPGGMPGGFSFREADDIFASMFGGGMPRGKGRMGPNMDGLFPGGMPGAMHGMGGSMGGMPDVFGGGGIQGQVFSRGVLPDTQYTKSYWLI